MYLSRPEDLASFCKRASVFDVLAIDTEFIREKTYYAELCLIQLATPEEIVLVDPIKIQNLSVLRDLIVDPSRTKVLHACGQDLEILARRFGQTITNVFDTQFVSPYVGYKYQIGYSPLVENVFGVHLSKTESLTDWSKRPLDSKQLSYAAEDVAYLLRLHKHLEKRLVQLTRYDWVQEDMQSYARDFQIPPDPNEMFLHVKHITSLSNQDLAVAKELSSLREHVARTRNQVRRWVFSDEFIIEVSKRKPKNRQQLLRLRGSDSLSKDLVNSIVQAVARGLKQTAPKLSNPRFLLKRAAQGDVQATLDLMNALIRILAKQHEIAPQILCARDDLVLFIAHDRRSRLYQTWRYELAGKQLEQLLSGELGLTVKNNVIEILTHA